MMDKSSSQEPFYRVQFISHDQNQGFTLYKFKIIGPNNIGFHLVDRYSSMKNFSSSLKKTTLRGAQGIPHFPPKKFLGNKEENFLKLRQTNLQNYFSVFLNHPKVVRSQALFEYFHSKAQEKEKVKELLQSLDKKATPSKEAPKPAAVPIISQAEKNYNEEIKLKEQGESTADLPKFDWKGFDEACRNIVEETSKRLLDLAQDEGPISDHGDGIQMRQEKFKKEFDRLNFQFETISLQNPKSDVHSEEYLEQADDTIKTEYEQLGTDLNQIFEILYNKSRQVFAIDDSEIVCFN